MHGTTNSIYDCPDYTADEDQSLQDPAVQEKLRWRREILDSELIYYADLTLLITVRNLIDLV